MQEWVDFGTKENMSIRLLRLKTVERENLVSIPMIDKNLDKTYFFLFVLRKQLLSHC